jgi:hypothetical protein
MGLMVMSSMPQDSYQRGMDEQVGQGCRYSHRSANRAASLVQL